MKVRSKVWIEKRGKLVFGEGKARLLQAIEEAKSINKAAEKMGMSFRHAWGYITTIEKRIGFPLLNRKRGGEGGGGSDLTPQAKRLLKEYEKLDKSVKDFTDKKFKKLFKKGKF